jgi:hypothetical protein
MLPIPDNRKIFNLCLWVFAGFAILVILTSCSPYHPTPTATPTLTPSKAYQITATADQPPATPTPTPTLTVRANKCRLNKDGARIADCFRLLTKGVKP